MASSSSGATPVGTPRPAANAARRGDSEDYFCVPLSPEQEAALLYAADLVAPAESILRAITLDPARNANKQPWLMLFELFEVLRKRAEHDGLAERYKAQFKQSAPAWTEGSGALDPRRAQSRDRRDFFILQPDAAGELAPEIGQLVAFAESLGTVRVELGRIESISAEEATMLVTALQRLRRADIPMWFNGAPSLAGVLRAAFNERISEVTRSYWLLLFELYVLLGQRESFEELGLEYAVAFEMPPPGWETYVNRVAAASRPALAEAASDPTGKGFALKGVIAAASEDQLAGLVGYAAGLTEVVVDMGKVIRIDFASSAQFYHVVKTLRQNGRRIFLVNLSELNAALLESFGFNGHATLVRRRPN